MARMADIGQMRTKINIIRLTKGRDVEGTPTEVQTDLFGGAVWCKWVWEHGSQIMDELRVETTEKATVTMHWSDKPSVEDIVMKGNDRYEIVAMNNVEETNRYLELYVRRAVPS